MGQKADGAPQNAHGRGSAWQLSNGTWRCRVQIDKQRVTGAGRTEREARAEMNRRVRAMARALVAPPMPVDLPKGREFVRLTDPAFRRWIYGRDEGRCGICDQPVAFVDMHIDHVRPRIEGGNDHVSNVRISHPACNLRRRHERDRLVRA